MKFQAVLTLIAILILPSLAFCADWEKLETQNFIIFYPPDEPGAAKTLSSAAEDIRAATVFAIGYDFKHKTRVYLAPDRETYAAVQPRAKIPEWSVGVAFEDENMMVIYTPKGAANQRFNYDMIRVFHHELCHIVLGMALRKQHIPRWLDEGFAKHQAREWSTGNSLRMTVAIVTGRFIPLSDLMFHWPSSESKARIAYLESQTFVAYLDRIGALPRIIAHMRKGETAEQAVASATGYPLNILEKRWTNYLKRTHTWLYLMMRTEFIWPLMALLFLYVYLHVKIRSRRKLARMALEDEVEEHRVYH